MNEYSLAKVQFSFSFFIIVTVLFSSFMNAKLERNLLFTTI